MRNLLISVCIMGTQVICKLADAKFLDNPLSVSKISSVGGAVCSFFGVDGSDTVVVGEQEVDVGPPQTQIRGVCDSL